MSRKVYFEDYEDVVMPEFNAVARMNELMKSDEDGSLLFYEDRAWSYREELSYDYDKETALFIIAAQIASDMGKHKRGLPAWKYFEMDEEELQKYGSDEIAVTLEALSKGDPELINKVEGAIKFDYQIKDLLVSLAVTKASHSKKFHYHISFEPDQNGYDSIVTYFEFKDSDGNIRQVSFHTFEYDRNGEETRGGGLLKLMKNRARDVYMKWDKKKGGSRESCKELLKAFA